METGPARAAFGRDRLAALVALATAVCLALGFVLSKGTQSLMPGPLASAHGAIENCSACHATSGDGKVSWIAGLAASNPHADSKACLTCHKMPDTAFNAHSASAEVLKQSTARLTKTAAQTPMPLAATAQSAAFPMHEIAAGGLQCATCHQEHKGVQAKLNTISNEQCRSCHVVKFDSFDGDHPEFENYPFERRTRIIYDHAGHFDKHYPEVAKKDPGKRIPATCSTCHDSRDDRRVMAVAPFDKTCATCHLDQIVGKERVSGPKGVAFLTLPGLDLATLKSKGAAIGEWPDASEAALTPFMKVMISRTAQGSSLIRAVERLNLQDLSQASDADIKAVANLVWEVKGLFHALIKGKASDVLGDFSIGGGAKLSAELVADLTASIPRDVILGAQQQWLPNLAAEMSKGADSAGPQPGDPSVIADQGMGPPTPEQPFQPSAEQAPEEAEASAASPEDSDAATAAPKKTRTADPPPCLASVFGQCLLLKTAPVESGNAANATAPGGTTPKGTEPPGRMNAGVRDGAIEVAAGEPRDDAGQTGGPITGRRDLPSGTPRAIEAQSKDAAKASEPKASPRVPNSSKNKPRSGEPNAVEEPAPSIEPEHALGPGVQPAGTATNQSDDLLFPSDEERRAIEAHNKQSGRSARPNTVATTKLGAGPFSVTSPQPRAVPVISIDSDVDPESWAEYGGWYRQDYAIFYRPKGHKDRFIYSWLFLTGPQAWKGDASPAAAVFDVLTSKDAQGSCTKCHSVDDLDGKGRAVNFAPPSAESKRGRFTNFIHEPHFQAVGIGQRIGIVENRGCLTCHSLVSPKSEEALPVPVSDTTSAGEKAGSPYLKTFEKGDPHKFNSNFDVMKKDLCQTCHTSNVARQDCLLCHTYHLDGVSTPIMNTKLPIE